MTDKEARRRLKALGLTGPYCSRNGSHPYQAATATASTAQTGKVEVKARARQCYGEGETPYHLGRSARRKLVEGCEELFGQRGGEGTDDSRAAAAAGG